MRLESRIFPNILASSKACFFLNEYLSRGKAPVMTFCHIHPDREARVTCQKNNLRGYCGDCLEDGVPCFDPVIYCKFRGQCIIWELARDAGLHRPAEE